MTALSALFRRRVGLLALVVIGASAFGSSSADRDARAYLDAHNAVRAAVHKPAGYRGTWTPVPPIAWSDEVAAGAQAWAEHLRDSNNCKLKHSDVRLGENLAYGKDLEPGGAVKLWASEIAKYRYSPTYDFEIVTGHYTQVVWRKTTHIGCGRATCGSTVVIACRYSPAGNRIGSAPY